MSRIGKIARLPTAVREELNERLDEGEPQGQLVTWLNGRDDVQAVLKAHYHGRPISDQNLSLWVHGGYEDWKHQQASLDVASRFVEDTSAVAEVMAKEAGAEAKSLLASFVSDRVAMMAALSIGELLMATRRMEDGTEKRRAILKIIRGLVRLRKTDRERERAEREAKQAENSAELHEHWAEQARRRPAFAKASAGRPSFAESSSTADRTAGTLSVPEAAKRRCRRPEDAEGDSDQTSDARGQLIEDTPLDELSDAELMRRMEELKALDTGKLRDGKWAAATGQPSFAEPTAGRPREEEE